MHDAIVIDRQNPLHLFSEMGDAHRVNQLLDAGAPINAPDDHDWTPLMLACWRGRIAVARLLLDRGAEMDVTNREGQTSLHLAACYNRMDIAELLLRNDARLDMRDRDGMTALDCAKRNGHALLAAALAHELEHRPPDPVPRLGRRLRSGM